jgi:HD-like signal output (HDOD) protein
MSGDPNKASRAGVESGLADVLAKIEIPPRPAVLDEVMGEMQKDEPDYRHLSRLITSDVGLAATLIKTANSPVFGYRSRASTVREALTMLGLVMVARTVAAYGIRNVLPESAAMRGFWESSARVAQLAGWLARTLGIEEGIRTPDAYTYGLFRDCGIPVLMKVREGYERVLAAAAAEPLRPFTAVEVETLTINHAMVGSVMAQSWYLPELYCQAIFHHHDPEAFAGDGVTPAVRRMVALGQLAEWLQGDKSDAAAYEWNKLGAATLDALRLTPAQADALRPEAAAVLLIADHHQ